jgi:hypothetical protein
MRAPRLVGLALVVALAACDPASFGPAQPAPDAGASPEASILPRPLATAAPLDAGSPRDVDAGRFADAAPPPPKPLEPGAILPADQLLRELSGLVLIAEWRWRSVPGSPKLQEVATEVIDRARKLTRGECQVRLSPHGRMRLSLVSRGMPLSPGSALVSRSDHYGHLVVWPDEQRYRAFPPGVLRALLGEGRADMTPLSRPRERSVGEGEKLGVKTRKVELSSSYGSVRLELATVPEAADAAPLLCRLLVEVVGVDPGIESCAPAELPLAAEYRWREREGADLSFEVTAMTRQTDVSGQELAVPPVRARAQSDGLPIASRFFDDNELGRWRKQDAPPPEPSDAGAPETGLVAVNRSDVPLYLLVDGVPIGVVRPWGEMRAPGLRPGRYTMQWRSFLGETVGDAAEHDVPARLVWGQEEKREERDGG